MYRETIMIYSTDVYCVDYTPIILQVGHTYSRKDKFLYPNKIKKTNLRQRRWRGNNRESKKQYYEKRELQKS